VNQQISYWEPVLDDESGEPLVYLQDTEDKSGLHLAGAPIERHVQREMSDEEQSEWDARHAASVDETQTNPLIAQIEAMSDDERAQLAALLKEGLA
jgi:hypothetical protein